MKRLVVFGAMLALLLGVVGTVGASDEPPPDPTRPIDDPIPGHVRQGPVRFQLEVRAFGAGLTAPLYGTFAPGSNLAAP